MTLVTFPLLLYRAGVAEALADHVHGHASEQQQRCVRMPQIVQQGTACGTQVWGGHSS